jgi:hypothetical protein
MNLSHSPKGEVEEDYAWTHIHISNLPQISRSCNSAAPFLYSYLYYQVEEVPLGCWITKHKLIITSGYHYTTVHIQSCQADLLYSSAAIIH